MFIVFVLHESLHVFENQMHACTTIDQHAHACDLMPKNPPFVGSFFLILDENGGKPINILQTT